MTVPSRRLRTRLFFAGVTLAALIACDHGYMDVPAKGPDTVPSPARSDAAAPERSTSPDPAAPAGARAAGDSLGGQVTLADALKDKVPPGATLFIIARQVGVDRGPPLATARLSADAFPVTFHLGQENVMMQGVPFQGQVSLSARLDADGNAMTRGEGDITGALSAPVTVGQQDIKLELNQPYTP